MLGLELMAAERRMEASTIQIETTRTGHSNPQENLVNTQKITIETAVAAPIKAVCGPPTRHLD